MNGCLGVHTVPEGGYSRDAAVQSIREIGGKYVTVTNDAALCQMVLDVGGVPLYRVHTQDWNDDDADGHFDARVYVRKLHSEAPAGSVLYIANEVGINNPERLNAWTLEAVDEANQLGRKVVAFNWSYLNPPHSIWDILAPSARALVSGGHFFGWHEGFDTTYDTLAKAYPEAIGRFRYCQQRFGGKHIITEFAASKTPHDGWKTWLTWEQWAAMLEAAVRDVYAPNGAFVTPYTLFRWRRGFEYYDAPELKAAMNRMNRSYPVTQPTAPIVSPPTSGGIKGIVASFPQGVAYRNIRTQPASNATDIGDLKPNEDIIAYVNARVNDWCYIERLADGVKGWSLWTGVVFAPELLPPAEKTYTMTESERLVLLDQLTRSIADLTAAKALVEGLPSGGL